LGVKVCLLWIFWAENRTHQQSSINIMDNGIKIEGISDKSAIAFSNTIVKCNKLIEAANSFLLESSIADDVSIAFDQVLREFEINIECDEDAWTKKGIECEILQPNVSDWQKGNFKINVSISFEFTPEVDESEQKTNRSNTDSPLDEIRQMIN
jgi:hypothetical protein